MAATVPETRPSPKNDASIANSVNRLEALLNRGADCMADEECYQALAEEMRLLHASLRTHHAVDQLSAAQQSVAIPPELSGQVECLRQEHSHMIGTLDRLVRRVERIAGSPVEEMDVFVLRCRELIATIRRHEAEEDRLFYMAVWRDTGGES